MSFSGSGELKKDEGTTKERNSFSAHIVARAHRGPMKGGPNSDQKFAEIGTRPWPYIVMVGAKLFHAHYYC